MEHLQNMFSLYSIYHVGLQELKISANLTCSAMVQSLSHSSGNPAASMLGTLSRKASIRAKTCHCLLSPSRWWFQPI